MLNKLIAGATLMLVACSTNAIVLEQSRTVTSSTTNFEVTVSFDKFDDMGGTRILDSVIVSIAGLVEGFASVESLDNKAATVTATISADLALVGPLGRLLAAPIPSVSRSFNATAYDGEIDFMGGSGHIFSDLGASQFDSATLFDLPTLMFFTGTGQAEFMFSAVATSLATGSGNVVSQISTSAGGEVFVIYEYTNLAREVSAPAGLAILGIILLAIAGINRAKQ